MKILPTFIANLAHGVGLLLLRFSAHLHGHGTMQGGILSKCKSKNTLPVHSEVMPKPFIRVLTAHHMLKNSGWKHKYLSGP